MQIIDQSWEWIQKPVNPLQTIELAGRTCYKSEALIGCTNKDALDPKIEFDCSGYEDKPCKTTECDYHSSHKFLKMIISRGHETVIEHVNASLRIITNRGVTHELVRHRLASFSQESTRYVNYKGGMEFIKPVWINEDIDESGENFNPNIDESLEESVAISSWIDSMQKSEAAYIRLINNGWRPEQAREVLPNSLKTEIVVTANLREWRHIFNMRCQKAAHPQIRAIFRDILLAFTQEFPIIFDDIAVKHLYKE